MRGGRLRLQRWCGRCGVLLDGEPALACCTPITDEDHVIEPLAGFTVIRDLVVDRRDLDDRLSTTYRRVRTEDVRPEDVDQFDLTHIDDLYTTVTCTRCGLCDSACPVHTEMPDQYAGPATMVATAFRYMESYDQGDRVLEAVSNGLYRCIECGRCDEVCPRMEIDHLKLWAMLRTAAEERDLVPSYAR